MMTVANIFHSIPNTLAEELFETLSLTQHLKIERIVSQGHITAEAQWYEQAQAEWVLVLQGQAQLQFAEQESLLDLKAGDYVLIPAHQRHRVAWTEPFNSTIWLAIHFDESEHG
jgi:cupin 2 domain-containing protein